MVESIITVVLAIAAGPGVVLFALVRLWLEVRPYRWANMQAVITGAWIERQYIRPGAYQAVPKVQFEYELFGRQIKAIQAIYSFGTSKSAHERLAKYQIGSQIVIKVSPVRPELACVEYGVSLPTIVLILLGSLVCTLELLVLKQPG